jgi:Type IV secretion-system coupling protein DNA-binding domain
MHARPSETPTTILGFSLSPWDAMADFVRGETGVYPVHLSDEDRLQHIAVLGKSGMGKSTLLKTMISQDLERGYGVALVEPHGDLSQEVLDLVPRERIRDVIYLNPGDLDWPVGFNPLEGVREPERHLVAAGVVSIFTHLWPDFWGPRSDWIVRNVLYTLFENPGSTLLDLTRIFADEDYRRRALANVRTPEVLDFWHGEYEAWPAAHRQEAIAPLQNKAGEFRLTPLVRNILGQRKNRFSLREAMDRGKIVIANFSKAHLGEDLSAFLGSLFLTRFLLAGLSRGDVPEETRRPFFLYVDELASFGAERAVASMLSELRKFRIGVVTTQQFVIQTDEKLRAALFGNASTILTFRVSAEDAEYLEKEFSPATAQELVNLDRFHMYVKTSVQGVTKTPFPAVTLPPPQLARSYRADIIRASREQYARPRAQVETTARTP